MKKKCNKYASNTKTPVFEDHRQINQAARARWISGQTFPVAQTMGANLNNDMHAHKKNPDSYKATKETESERIIQLLKRTDKHRVRRAMSRNRCQRLCTSSTERGIYIVPVDVYCAVLRDGRKKIVRCRARVLRVGVSVLCVLRLVPSFGRFGRSHIRHIHNSGNDLF